MCEKGKGSCVNRLDIEAVWKGREQVRREGEATEENKTTEKRKKK